MTRPIHLLLLIASGCAYPKMYADRENSAGSSGVETGGTSNDAGNTIPSAGTGGRGSGGAAGRIEAGGGSSAGETARAGQAGLYESGGTGQSGAGQGGTVVNGGTAGSGQGGIARGGTAGAGQGGTPIGGTAGTGLGGTGTGRSGEAGLNVGGSNAGLFEQGGSEAGAPGIGGSSEGGAENGGAALGGAPSGGTGDGGASDGGTSQGGAGLGGTGEGGSLGGSGVGGGDPSSPGCAITTPLASGTYSIQMGEDNREYIVDVPTPYEADHPYRLVFAWHPLGGTATSTAYGGYYGLMDLAQSSAIFVAPQGLDDGSGDGWENPGGRDIGFLQAMLTHLDDNLCIDRGRRFSVGFSAGASMSYTVGCEMGDVFRGLAAMSGGLLSGCSEANPHPIAVWASHGDNDIFIPTSSGWDARDKFVNRNGCRTSSEPTAPDPPCVTYLGCDDGYPVHWCQFSGEHVIPDFAADAIWEFFKDL